MPSAKSAFETVLNCAAIAVCVVAFWALFVWAMGDPIPGIVRG